LLDLSSILGLIPPEAGT